jgi:crotonobetaine/carnitine-CoA ligase
VVELPLSLTATAPTTAILLHTAKADVSLVETAFAERNAAAFDVVRRHARTISLGGELAGATPADDLRGSALPPAPGPTDPAVVMMTSGTTGRSKGAVLPHFAAVRHARRVSATMQYGPDDVLFNVFPWHHVNVRHAALLPALLSGARLVSHPTFSATRFWDICREQDITAFNFMGAVVAILARAEPANLDRDHRVRRGYGGPAPAALCQLFAQRFGVELLEAYASTELGDVATNALPDWRPGTAGRVLPEYEVRINDEAGAQLPPGQVGQLAVRARAAGIRFLRYLDDEGGVPAWDDWFVTGDRALITDDGYLQFHGRRADVIRRRGENISAWEVEQALSVMPGVLDVAVVGVPSQLTEEDVFVAVTAVPGADVSAAGVRAWCAQRLPQHCVPRYVLLDAELPRNSSGKIEKQALRDDATLGAAWDSEQR